MSGVVIAILAVFIIAVLWISGGSLFTQPAPPSVNLETPQTEKEVTSDESQTISEKQVLRIYTANYRAREPEDEYIEIQADYSNTVPVNITGWKLQNRKGDVFIIPTGAGLPYSARVNTQENIVLKPGERAIVVTGKSSLYTSFRPNLCTGYFNRLYEFRPALPENCPAPDQEKGIGAQDDACFLYFKILPRCKTPDLSDIPLEADFKCREFIDERLSYAGCVEFHKKDAGFFSDEWRIYLEEGREIWSDIRETIKLFDQNSNLVAETSI